MLHGACIFFCGLLIVSLTEMCSAYPFPQEGLKSKCMATTHHLSIVSSIVSLETQYLTVKSELNPHFSQFLLMKSNLFLVHFPFFSGHLPTPPPHPLQAATHISTVAIDLTKSSSPTWLAGNPIFSGYFSHSNLFIGDSEGLPG